MPTPELIANLGGYSGVSAEVEAASRALRIAQWPAAVLGSYRAEFVTGAMAAGIASGSPFFSFRWPAAASPNLALIRSVRLWVLSATGFTAGAASFTMVLQRSFTVQDTAGAAQAFSPTVAKLRWSHPTSLADVYIATTAALTPGTRTADTLSLARLRVNFDATASAVELVNTVLWGPDSPLSYPVVLAQNEGFVLQCIVPATGTWTAGITVAWDEVASF